VASRFSCLAEPICTVQAGAGDSRSGGENVALAIAYDKTAIDYLGASSSFECWERIPVDLKHAFLMGASKKKPTRSNTPWGD
jgi:hypothetical protein